MVLAKIDWNIPSVVALDFVDHILQGLVKSPGLSLSSSQVRAKTQDLIFRCYIDHRLALYQPGVIAAACVLFSLRPLLEMPPPCILPETPASSSLSSLDSLSSSSFLIESPTNSNTSSPFSNSSTSLNCSFHSLPCSSSSPLPQSSPQSNKSPFRTPESPIPTKLDVNRKIPKSPDMDKITRSVQKITLVQKTILQKCLEELEQEVESSIFPPTPSPSLSEENLCGNKETPFKDNLPNAPLSPLPQAAKTLFPLNLKTPTKLLDVTDCS